jgi:hypothetical protein
MRFAARKNGYLHTLGTQLELAVLFSIWLPLKKKNMAGSYFQFDCENILAPHSHRVAER